MTRSSTGPQASGLAPLPIDWGSALRGAAQVVLVSADDFDARHRQWVQSVHDRMQREGLRGDWAAQESAALQAEARDRIIGQLVYFITAMGLLALALYACTHWRVELAVPIACLPLALTWSVQAADHRHRKARPASVLH